MEIAKSKPSRNSAFEILRIIAIIFIIAHHFSVHGAFDFSELGNSFLITFNRTWTDLLLQLGKVGVNLFVLISGYFLIDNNKFKSKKIISIILMMFIFSISLGLIFFFVEKKEFSISLLHSMIFPFGDNLWWFMTSYLVLYILSPLINRGIKAMNKKMHLILIIILLIIWSLLPTFLYENYGYSIFGWFITLYLIASYIKLYDINLKMKPWLGIILSVGIFLIWFAIRNVLHAYINPDKDILRRIIGWFALDDMNNFVQIISVITFFLSFKGIKMKEIKPINYIASFTLGIYLFHDHIDMRKFLWITLFKNASFAASPLLILYSIGIILLVFLMGLAVAIIYKYSIGLLIDKFLSWLDKKCLYKIDNSFNEPPIEEKE